jgi:hypothetical protein
VTDGQRDPRVPVTHLETGWVFWSPFARLETVRAVDHDVSSLVWTDFTGEDHPWRFFSTDQLVAMPPPAYRDLGQPELRIVELPRRHGSRGSINAVPTSRHVQIPDFRHTLVDAVPLADGGEGRGWRVTDRPYGRSTDKQHADYPTRAKARSAVMHLARAHARALGVPLRVETKEDLQW